MDSGKADIHVGRWFKYCSNQKAFGVIQSKFPAAVTKNTTNNKPETKKVFLFVAILWCICYYFKGCNENSLRRV